MRSGAAAGRLIAAVLVVGVFFVIGMESHCKSQQREAQADQRVNKQEAAPVATPSFIPVVSEKLVIAPGKVEATRQLLVGPSSLRLILTASQRILLTVMPRAEARNSKTQDQIAGKMEGSRCANSGQGNVTLLCELSETDKEMVVVADTRDATKGMMDSFDPKNSDDEAAPRLPWICSSRRR